MLKLQDYLSNYLKIYQMENAGVKLFFRISHGTSFKFQNEFSRLYQILRTNSKKNLYGDKKTNLGHGKKMERLIFNLGKIKRAIVSYLT